MGEIAEAMLSGLFCQTCGEYLDDGEPGYPRSCGGCKADEPKKKKAIDAAEHERRRKRNRKNKEKRRRRAGRLKAERDKGADS